MTAVTRSVYAQGWYAGDRCYHPALPPKRLSMIDDFVAFGATMLSWPMLGGGGIALPFLEEEAYGRMPARLRQYGYVNDADFAAACRARGITPFGVIFSTQGWDVPAWVDDDSGELLSVNEIPDGVTPVRAGLSAFSRDALPGAWKPFASYFPEGLRNSRGEPVDDLFEECCTRDIDGRPLRARWVEFADREHECRFMNLNNPVWREYLKAAARIQIDAGVGGIQFDEPDTPIVALLYGGDFSIDTLAGFHDHLRRERPADVAHLLDADFDYREWLLAHGGRVVDIDAEGDEGGLARHYVRYLRIAQSRHFRELADYAREYARSLGRELLVSSNLFDCAMWHDGLVPSVDVLVPEQRTTRYRQPGWTRYAAAFAGGKPICVSVNPYGGVLIELNELVNRGEGLTRYRTMMYEAAALGASMAVPYGAWMGTEQRDAFWPAIGVSREVQAFLVEHEDLFSTSTLNEVGLLFDVEANLIPNVRKALRPLELPPREGPEPELPSIEVAELIGAAGVPFDVVLRHDAAVRPDGIDTAALARYRLLVIAEPFHLDAELATAILGHLDGGATLAVAAEVTGEGAERVLAHANARRTRPDDLAPHEPQTTLDVDAPWAANIMALGDGRAALHLVRYDAEERPERDVVAEVRMPFPVTHAIVHVPGRASVVAETTDGRDGRVAVTVPAMGPYAIVELRGETPSTGTEGE
jgi:hypothetical protein